MKAIVPLQRFWHEGVVEFNMNHWWGMAQWPLRLDACARACKILEAQECGVKFNLASLAALGKSTHGSELACFKRSELALQTWNT